MYSHTEYNFLTQLYTFGIIDIPIFRALLSCVFYVFEIVEYPVDIFFSWKGLLLDY